MKSSASTTAVRRLIVNGDDFGFSGAVNAGIADAHRRGILTSTTLLANGEAFNGAVRVARENPGLGVGVHLNLVRGRALCLPEEIPLLAGAGGEFRPFRFRRMTRGFLAQAEREYRAQFAKVLAAGIRPTHVDFEKHHAWQGALYALACRVAADHGVFRVRNLAEPLWFSLRRLGVPSFRNLGMAALLRAGFTLGGGGRRARRLRFSAPDHFFGQLRIGGMTEAVWLRLLAALPPGVSEVMTHPGLADEDGGDGGGWIAARRAGEHAALVSPAVRGAVAAGGIEPVNYSALRNTPLQNGGRGA